MFNQFACQIVLIRNELVIQSRVSKKRTTDVLFSLVRASVKPWLASNFGNGVLEEFEVIPTDADYCRNFPNFDRDLQICGREQDSSSDLGSLCSSQAGTPLICPGIGRNGEDGHFSPVLVRGVHACLPSILKSLAKIDFTLQALKLVLGCLGLFPSSGGELGCLDT